MIALGFNSVGLVNNAVCWLYIPHESKGKLMYTHLFLLQMAALALLQASTAEK
jgi:hypothetical protein